MIKDCKAPIHLVKYMTEKGLTKPLALYLSLKKLFSSGHIHDFRAVDTRKLSYPVSKQTYYKYLRILQREKLVDGDGVVYTRGKYKRTPVKAHKGLLLKGINNVPIHDHTNKKKAKFIYLTNDKTLPDSLERVALNRNLKAQELKMKKKSLHNVLCQVLTKSSVGETITSSSANLRLSASLSFKKVANIIGLRSASSGYRRERKWRRDGFIKTSQRFLLLCSASHATAKELLLDPRNIKLREYIVRPLANEIQIQNPTFGLKPKSVSFFDNF